MTDDPQFVGIPTETVRGHGDPVVSTARYITTADARRLAKEWRHERRDGESWLRWRLRILLYDGR